jgi:hypothetical protein
MGMAAKVTRASSSERIRDGRQDPRERSADDGIDDIHSGVESNAKQTIHEGLRMRSSNFEEERGLESGGSPVLLMVIG